MVINNAGFVDSARWLENAIFVLARNSLSDYEVPVSGDYYRDIVIYTVLLKADISNSIKPGNERQVLLAEIEV